MSEAKTSKVIQREPIHLIVFLGIEVGHPSRP